MPALTRRRLQQSLLVELGLRAFDADDLDAFVNSAVYSLAQGLNVSLVGAFSFAEDHLRLDKGLGWPDGGPDPLVLSLADPHVDGVLWAGEPVLLNGDTPPTLARLGVVSGLCVRVGGAGEPAGLLGAYSVEPRSFSQDDVGFLSAVAIMLSGALERQDTVRALHESEVRARAVLETTVDGVITIDERGRIEAFNPSAERIFGYSEEEVAGKNIHILMPEPYHSEHDGYLNAYMETGHRRIIGIGREVTGLRKDGSTFPLDLAVGEVRIHGRRVFTGIVRDITARRELETEVLRIAEGERRRIGQDLHDGLGQMLTGTALIARGLARTLRNDGSDSAEDAEEVVTLIKEADAQARALARGLVPVELETNALSVALERMAANTSRLFEIDCRLDTVVEADEILQDPIPTHLFRIAQEAVSNAVRHGKASEVTISLVRRPDQLRLIIRDNGIGVGDTQRSDSLSADVQTDANRGLGVRIMHYRSRVLGATLEIRPGADVGTVVTCSLPKHALQ